MRDLPLQYTAMKRLTLLLLFSLLSACSTLTERFEIPIYSSSIPDAWAMEGRLNATVDSKTESASFELSRQGKYHQLTLNNSFGFGQIQVKQTAQGLLVDGKLTGLSLQEWMLIELGWKFPIAKLERLVFKHDLKDAEGWWMKVSKYQSINGITYPKIVHFKSEYRAIKIKLLLKEINRLK
ncbi:MAG: Outer-membrane lipoprotein LolB [Catillopecten margaritatus gill symbiont]|uniref:Outer-membrane lipoprotein LolB n=1 Tax=Catillopecten margaritatus gill symbiont TaxID=3083288 RepID=A0AAU6PFC7_9GAMM